MTEHGIEKFVALIGIDGADRKALIIVPAMGTPYAGTVRTADPTALPAADAERSAGVPGTGTEPGGHRRAGQRSARSIP